LTLHLARENSNTAFAEAEPAAKPFQDKFGGLSTLDRPPPHPKKNCRLNSNMSLSVQYSGGPSVMRGLAFALQTIMTIFGAGDGNRTHDIQLGKLTFYL
jgi:hypothetical protein